MTMTMTMTAHLQMGQNRAVPAARCQCRLHMQHSPLRDERKLTQYLRGNPNHALQRFNGVVIDYVYERGRRQVCDGDQGVSPELGGDGVMVVGDGILDKGCHDFVGAVDFVKHLDFVWWW